MSVSSVSRRRIEQEETEEANQQPRSQLTGADSLHSTHKRTDVGGSTGEAGVAEPMTDDSEAGGDEWSTDDVEEGRLGGRSSRKSMAMQKSRTSPTFTVDKEELLAAREADGADENHSSGEGDGRSATQAIDPYTKSVLDYCKVFDEQFEELKTMQETELTGEGDGDCVKGGGVDDAQEAVQPRESLLTEWRELEASKRSEALARRERRKHLQLYRAEAHDEKARVLQKSIANVQKSYAGLGEMGKGNAGLQGAETGTRKQHPCAAERAEAQCEKNVHDSGQKERLDDSEDDPLFGEANRPTTSSTCSSMDSEMAKRELRRKKVAPPGLQLAEDVNPGYDPELAPPFIVPMKAVRKGGAALDKALHSLERLEQPECVDLWGGKSSHDSVEEEFERAVEWWQKNDGPEMKKKEQEVFAEMMNSAIIPMPGSGRMHIARPEVRDKYAATALGKEGALSFVDGEPVYTDRGPAVLEEEKRAKAKLVRVELNLFKALQNAISEEENIQKFNDVYADEDEGQNTMFDPWENEWPPPETLGVGWLDDIEHDIYQRCNRGLPAEKVHHSDPWQQRWWEQFQAELILEATGLKWNGFDIVPDPNRGPMSPDVETWWVEQQLGIGNLTDFLAREHETQAPNEPPLSFADLFHQLRPAFNGPQVDYSAVKPSESDLIVPDDLATVQDAIKYALLEQGGNLSTMKCWDPWRHRMAPLPSPPQLSPGSTLQPDPLVAAAMAERGSEGRGGDSGKGDSFEAQGARRAGVQNVHATRMPHGMLDLESSSRSTNGGKGLGMQPSFDDECVEPDRPAHGLGLTELSGYDVEDTGFWTRMQAAIQDVDIDRMVNDTALIANTYRAFGESGRAHDTDISARWSVLRQKMHQPLQHAPNSSASGGGPDCRVIVEAPPGVFFYPASRIFCKAGDYIWDLCLIVPSLCWIEMSGQGSDATNLWGMIMLRPFSKGSFGGLFFCYLTRVSYEPTMVVQGGPWRFDQCDIRSSTELASVALITLDRADASLSECAIGGLEPVVSLCAFVLAAVGSKAGREPRVHAASRNRSTDEKARACLCVCARVEYRF